MAHSIQVIGDKVAILNDLDLLMFLGFMLAELAEHAERYPALQAAAVMWSQCRATSAPGTIDLHLEEVMNHAAARTHFEDLLRTVELQLDRFGDIVPKSHVESLQAQWPIAELKPGVPDVVFNPNYPTVRVKDVIAQLRGLIVV